MLRLHRSARRLTATTLLVVFVSALLGPVVALARVLSHEAAKHLHLPSMPQAHHHHDEAHEKQDHPNDLAPGSKSGAHSSQHACSSGDGQQLMSLAPLLKLLASPAAPAVLALPPAQRFLCRLFRAWDRQQAVVLVPPEHRKPKIPDLRIFLGSLVI
ncbi:hypothetical protein H8B13_18410 [Hymenobacter sp. BT188]|uniref:hypothetical protein n=1 Tax=Hymenobacter sp. BT188 TaxID=2763504 RepID=UPI0016513F2C|nr:hypothetical protein [Hymenobacter sp. BT188]MBC6608807.1 hypothetical protein [Hymenobacter sp. BT188]